jgi:hypothetical protein
VILVEATFQPSGKGNVPELERIHRRPTTDDRRPTTDDRRPTTNDRRPTTCLSPTADG